MTQQHITIFDTTLRDGEQSPGCSMNLSEKLRLAAILDEMGVDVIEAGFPVASNGDFQSVSEIAKASKNSTICGLARAIKGDIDAAAKATEGANKSRIHTFISTSPLHMKHKLKMEPAQVLDAINSSVSLACQYVDDVEWSAEDAVRTDIDFLCKAVDVAIKAGAKTINLPDTVGYALPNEYAHMFKTVLRQVDGARDIILSTHCHNDLGLAVANSLAGVDAGARQVECTINGIGERAGNAAMEEVLMAIRTRPDSLKFSSNVDTTKIMGASRTLSAITGFSVQPNKAIVGANAFAHESGIHQDGFLKNAQTYEIMTPESVGVKSSDIVLGKHSGSHAFRVRLEEFGYNLDDEELSAAFTRFKTLADNKKEVFEEDIIALVDDEISRAGDIIKLIDLRINAGTIGEQEASITLCVDGEDKKASVNGNGPVDAIFKAIRKIYPHDGASLKLYQVHAVTGGTDAQAEVTVKLEEGGLTVVGQGADSDTMVASAKAYLHALGKLIIKRTRAK